MPNKFNLSDFAHQVDVRDIPADYRTEARQLAVQFLHHLTVLGKMSHTQLESFLSEYSDQPPARELARKWIIGTWQYRDDLDRMIQSVSEHWDIARINIVDRNNLRLALYHMLHCPEIPPAVAINEAVELAKVFSTAQAPSFVNAILDALRRQIQSHKSSEPKGDNK